MRLFGLWLLFGALRGVEAQTQLTVGLLVPRGLPIDNLVGYNVSAGAMVSALNRATELGIYDPTRYNITIKWYYDQCDESLSAGYAARLIHDDHVRAIFGPVCSESSFVVGALARYKNIPVFLWGPASPIQFSPRTNYPTTLPFAGSVRGTFLSVSYVLSQYNWSRIAFVYSSLGDINQGFSTCKYFAESFEAQSGASANITETYIKHAINTSVSGFQTILNSVNNRARVIVSCLETQLEKRNYMRAAMANKMVGTEYVHLFVQMTSIGFGDPPFWIGKDGLDDQIKEAAKSVLILDKYLNTTEISSNAMDDIYKNIYGYPFYCKDCPKNATGSSLAVYLGDAFLTYLWLLNRTYHQYGPSQIRNTTAVLSFFDGVTFGVLQTVPSILGNTFTVTTGIRIAKYYLMGLNPNGEPTVYAMLENNFTPSYVNASNTIWATRGGVAPTESPKCGFNNEKCPPSALVYTGLVVGCIVLFFIVLAFLAISVYFFQRAQRRRLNSLWQIPHIYLMKTEEKSKTKSMRSINTQISNNTDSSRSTIMRQNTDHTEFLHYNQTIVVARKFEHPGKWSEHEESEFRRMRAIDHQNLNKFLGVSIIGNVSYIIWECCTRGNIIEVIKVHSFRMDSYIMCAMIRNIVEGLHYIHSSKFVQHGTLSAYRCVVGDRFEVKIQLYGLSGIKAKSIRRLDNETALYVAPEHLHGQQNEVGSQAGDIYSLGIICSVILNMKPAFGCEEKDEDIAEIVRSISRGKYPPVRPTLDIDPSIEVNPDLVSLVKKMWHEHPGDRPNINEIREILIRNIITSRSTNLMDYMFALMENNAAELEKDVQARTMELLTEQKKADVLLYRMMPREAADKLKIGHTVAPEVFESATVFFSDIVSFTVLASKSTPLQIINFLNDVYTLADSVIDKYDVYKVETIGDGMHVVSGVPRRNGVAHVKAIADMSIDFQRSVKMLRMGHLPDQQVQMRVGVHSASRIHVSASTKGLLSTHYPNQYTIFDRGEVLVKGIGAMHSHWLVPPEEVSGFQS